ncbi:TPA: hypothetical protein SMV40_002115 [Proteus mirabilis]|uniref:hypothetical protein n=1 Tax=Proteus mirabilis TaxID=584 RepID=UPI0023B2B1D0|nr:hypothetical protein [Proteus mirabilis]HEK3119614.1 hypothetical protein [Proteus mirabilis]
MRTEHTRSIQTINHATEVINSFFDDASEKNFSIRRLSVRTNPNRQLFIVTVDDDLVKGDFKVIPYAEVTVVKNKMRFTVNPLKQYPAMKSMFEAINNTIETSIFGFMKKFH